MENNNHLIGFFLVTFAILSIGLLFVNSSNVSIIGSPIDSYSNSVLITDFEKAQIFNGNSYFYSSSFSLNIGGTRTYLLRTSDSNVHLRNVRVSCEMSIVELRINEDVTFTNAGTSINSITNKNRQIGNTNEVLLNLNPSISNNGNLILVDGLVGNRQTAGSVLFTSDELILDVNTNYLLTIENKDGNNNDCYFSIFWFEK